MNRTKRALRRYRAERRQAELCRAREIAKTSAAARTTLFLQLLAEKRDPLVGLTRFAQQVAGKAPKFASDPATLELLQKMGTLTPYRSIESWMPQGKSTTALLRSLAEHLFAVYPTPAFLWGAFWQAPNGSLPKLVTQIASGTSLYKLVNQGVFPMQLTKKQCHLFMRSPARMSVMDALRHAQVKSYGGSELLSTEWRQSRYVKTLLNEDQEAFWQHVLAWFCRQRELKPSGIHALMHYLSFQYRNEPDFSMKGRTLASVTRAMLEWQEEMRLLRLAQGFNLPASGFANANWHGQAWSKRKQTFVNEHWSVAEILSTEHLLEEGRIMQHCVYSYRKQIKRGQCSIWTVTLNGRSTLTIEVNNKVRRIVQVKGKFNREPLEREWQIVQRWASLAGLRCG